MTVWWRGARVLATGTLLLPMLAACGSSAGDGAAEGAGDGESASAPAASSPVSEPSLLEEGDLPPASDLDDVSGGTVRAVPFADFAVATEQGVWVTGVAPGLVRYDDTGAVTARVRLGGQVVQALEESRGDVLVPVQGSSAPSLVRVDAATGRVEARIGLPGWPAEEAAVGADGGSAYVLVGEPEPRIVEVVGSRVRRTLPAPELAAAIRAGFGSLWVTTGEHTVVRIDPETDERTEIPVGWGPRFLDTGFGAVWVMNQGDGSVSRIDGETGEAEQIAVTGEPIGGGNLTVGAGAVWLRTDDAVVRLDPASRRATHVVDLPPGSGDAVATDAMLLVTNHDHLAVHPIPLPLPR